MFYHLTRSPLEATLPRLLERSLEAGMQVDLRGRDPELLDYLDQKLWLGEEESFLPHGLAGGPHDALQPVLLTTAEAAREGTRCLMVIDGAPVTDDEARSLDRVCILFDGADAEAVAKARDQWRQITAAGAVAEYWAQEEGPWQKKMSTEARGEAG